MSRIEICFKKLRKEGRAAFIPFFPVGYPDLPTSRRIIEGLIGAGADVLELGIPFTDSLADGPVVQQAYHRALEAGGSMAKALDLVKELRKSSEIPIVTMVAYNLIHRAGHREFARQAKAAGVDGVLPPDLSFEESSQLEQDLGMAGLDLIRLIAPTSSPERAARIARKAKGFVYYISRKGVTGVTGTMSGNLEESVARLREVSRAPVAVGFGVSTPEQVKEIGAYSDGVVIGSALIQALGKGPQGPENVIDLARRMRRALERE